MSNSDQVRAALSRYAACVPVERFENVNAEDRRHIESCPRCQTELALYREFQDSSVVADEGAAVSWIRAELERRSSANVPQKPGFLHRLWTWRLASAFGLAAVMLGFIALTMKQNEVLLPHDRATESYRAASIEVVSPVGEQSGPVAELVWKQLPGMTRYEIAITEVDGEVVWKSHTSDTRTGIPVAARSRMLPAKTLLWSVTALNSRGETIASSGVQKFWVKSKFISSGE